MINYQLEFDASKFDSKTVIQSIRQSFKEENNYAEYFKSLC